MSVEAARMGGVRSVWRHAARHSVSVTGAITILAVIIAFALGGAHLAPYDAAEQDLGARLMPPGWQGSEGWQWFGHRCAWTGHPVAHRHGRSPGFVRIGERGRGRGPGGYRRRDARGVQGWALRRDAALRDQHAARLPVLPARRDYRRHPAAERALGASPLLPSPTGSVRPGNLSDTLHIRELEYIEAVRVMRGGDARILLRHILPNERPTSSALDLRTRCCHRDGKRPQLRRARGADRDADLGPHAQRGTRRHADRVVAHGVSGASIFLLVLAINVLGEQLREYADPESRLQ